MNNFDFDPLAAEVFGSSNLLDSLADGPLEQSAEEISISTAEPVGRYGGHVEQECDYAIQLRDLCGLDDSTAAKMSGLATTVADAVITQLRKQASTSKLKASNLWPRLVKVSALDVTEDSANDLERFICAVAAERDDLAAIAARRLIG